MLSSTSAWKRFRRPARCRPRRRLTESTLIGNRDCQELAAPLAYLRNPGRKIDCDGARYPIFTLERSMSMMSLRMRSFAWNSFARPPESLSLT